jgi:hypothetical protein
MPENAAFFYFNPIGLPTSGEKFGLAAGYSLSVAENTKQRVWKPQVLAEYERVKTYCRQ